MTGAYSPPDVTSRLPCQWDYEQAQVDCVLCIGWWRVAYTNGEYTMTVGLGLEQRNIILLCLGIKLPRLPSKTGHKGQEMLAEG